MRRRMEIAAGGRSQRLAAGAVAALLGWALVGCEPVGVDPIAARVVDGELEFLFCDGISSRAILIETREGGGDWQAVTADQARSLSSGRPGWMLDPGAPATE